MRKIMFSGTGSGCGKTTVVCAVMRAMVRRGMKVSSFKCGPDYIDPMFHKTVTGTSAYNLDGVFCEKDTLCYQLHRFGGTSDISVIEGVMGYYDGVHGKGSSYSVAVLVESPCVMVINCRGMSYSIGAVMKGFLSYRTPSKIVGFIFNMLPTSLVETVKTICNELGTEYLGCIPPCPELRIESRHLGLVTADEISDLREKLDALSIIAEKNVYIDRICEIAESAAECEYNPLLLSYFPEDDKIAIAAARDKAFCFSYEENYALLRELGCDIRFFSPLSDSSLPEGICGLLLGGGYPELYAKRLSQNSDLLKAVRSAVQSGMPVIAECGGFMYLTSSIESDSSEVYPMTGILGGHSYKTDSLKRFGYMKMTAKADNLLCHAGEEILAHEYHYWDCTDNGSDFTYRKLGSGSIGECGFSSKSMYASFGHLYFYSNPHIAVNFVKKCRKYNAGL